MKPLCWSDSIGILFVLLTFAFVFLVGLAKILHWTPGPLCKRCCKRRHHHRHHNHRRRPLPVPLPFPPKQPECDDDRNRQPQQSRDDGDDDTNEFRERRTKRGGGREEEEEEVEEEERWRTRSRQETLAVADFLARASRLNNNAARLKNTQTTPSSGWHEYGLSAPTATVRQKTNPNRLRSSTATSIMSHTALVPANRGLYRH